MIKKLVFFLIIIASFFVFLNSKINNKTKPWFILLLEGTQFKVFEIKETVRDGVADTVTTRVLRNDVYVVMPKKILWFLKEESITNFSVKMLNDKGKYISACLSMSYDYKSGIISGQAYSVDTEGDFYIGEGKIIEGILKPTFLKGATFYFSPKAECGEFTCPGIQIVLPYSFEELKRIYEEQKGIRLLLRDTLSVPK